MKGVRSLTLNKKKVDEIQIQPAGSINEITVVMG